MVTKGTKRVGVLGFDGVNAVDVIGPTEVFANAGRPDFTRGESKGHYRTFLIGLSDAPFTAESGVRFVPDCRLADAPALDTLVVPGGRGLREAARDLSIPVLAERARLSPRHFSRRFHETFGCTPAQFVDGLRLTAARERLTAPGRTVDSVAASVGFASADVFRRRFRRRFGVAPSNYRERFLTAGSPGDSS